LGKKNEAFRFSLTKQKGSFVTP